MGILDLKLLNKGFDLFECSALLHHMQKPSLRLQSSLSVISQNDLLKLDLYSKFARSGIIKVKDIISNKLIPQTQECLRTMRISILSGDNPESINLLRLLDFYPTSMFRDPSFHVKSHRFTINTLRIILEENEIDLLGFILPKNIKIFYQNELSNDLLLSDLCLWNIFENKNPYLFSSIYQFLSYRQGILNSTRV